MTIAARKIQATFIQHPHNLRHGAELQERLEHELKPLLNRQIRGLNHHPSRIPIRPIGRESASSPRSALASRPEVSRLRMV